MTAQDFMGYYISEINKIPEKFKRIGEISKKWIYFNGEELINATRTIPYGVIERHNEEEGWGYQISPSVDNKIVISWEDLDNDTCNFEVTNDFFDDFGSYLKGVEDRVNKHNSEQIVKYQEHQKKLEKAKEAKEQKQYQEYLRLKAIYESA